MQRGAEPNLLSARSLSEVSGWQVIAVGRSIAAVSLAVIGHYQDSPLCAFRKSHRRPIAEGTAGKVSATLSTVTHGFICEEISCYLNKSTLDYLHGTGRSL